MDCPIIEQANEYASEMAGEYLATIDWKNINHEQWMTLIDVITKNFHLKHIELCATM